MINKYSNGLTLLFSEEFCERSPHIFIVKSSFAIVFIGKRKIKNIIKLTIFIWISLWILVLT